MNYKNLAAAAALGLFVTAPQADERGWYAGGGVGGSFMKNTETSDAGDGVEFEQELDSGWGLQGMIGYLFGNGWRAELELGYRQNDLDEIGFKSGFGGLDGSSSSDVDGDLSAISLMANAWYSFDFDSYFQPYVGGGFGLARVSARDIDVNGVDLVDDDDLVMAYQVGAGVDFVLREGLVLDVGYRYFGTDDPQLDGNGGADYDLDYRGHTAVVQARYLVGPRGGAADADRDGVPDERDRCAGTPPGTRVDVVGCAVDSDGDGVVNGRDQCENTPAGTVVDGTGCPVQAQAKRAIVDTDGDGVEDGSDECPNTPKGTLVLINGCTVIWVEGVNFDFDSAKIDLNAQRVLEHTARSLRDHRDMRVSITGYADSKGSDEYNVALGRRRAEAARDFLVSRGAQVEQISIGTMGESQPVAGNDSALGRARNRRIEIEVLNP